MGYFGGELAPLFDPDLAHDATRDMAESGGDFLFEHAVRNTPVSYTNTAFQYGGFAVARAPGTLKSRWVRHPVGHAADGLAEGFEVRVENTDPIAGYVEWDTPPHLIKPKLPGGRLRFRVWPTGELVFARLVKHPGTRGQHMMGLAIARAHIEFDEIVREDLHRWAHRAVVKAQGQTNLGGVSGF